MSRIGFLTLSATGHINPSLVLARALHQHGHEITYFNLPDTERAISEAGVRFASYGEGEFPIGTIAGMMKVSAELSGPAAFVDYTERMYRLFAAAFRGLPTLLRSEALDLLLIDQVFYCGGTVAEHIGVPFVSLANALLVNREAIIPPPNTLWPFDPSPDGIERNRKGWAAVDQAYSPLLSMVNAQRRVWSLPEYSNLLEDSFSPLAQICQQAPVLEFPREQAPATLHLVGHLQDDRALPTVLFEWSWLDGRPLIYATCGTLQNRVRSLFRAIIDACALMDVQLVVSLGRGGIPVESFGQLPGNVKLVDYVPQIEVLRRVAACVFHAGLNTTLDCLSLGIPTVLIPIASEQPGIAMRVARLGAGIVVPLSHVGGDTVAAAIRAVLTEASYAEAAQAASREMATLDSAAEAAKIIERVLTRVRE